MTLPWACGGCGQWQRTRVDGHGGKTYFSRPLLGGGHSSMVEPQIVVLDVAGSSPVGHPIPFSRSRRFCAGRTPPTDAITKGTKIGQGELNKPALAENLNLFSC